MIKIRTTQISVFAIQEVSASMKVFVTNSPQRGYRFNQDNEKVIDMEILFFQTKNRPRRDLALLVLVIKHHFETQSIQWGILDDPIW